MGGSKISTQGKEGKAVGWAEAGVKLSADTTAASAKVSEPFYPMGQDDLKWGIGDWGSLPCSDQSLDVDGVMQKVAWPCAR